MSREAQLVNLIADLFPADHELGPVLMEAYGEEYDALRRHLLVGAASPYSRASTAVSAIKAHPNAGISAALFDAMLKQRSDRSERIEEVRRLWIDPGGRPISDPTPAPANEPITMVIEVPLAKFEANRERYLAKLRESTHDPDTRVELRIVASLWLQIRTSPAGARLLLGRWREGSLTMLDDAPILDVQPGAIPWKLRYARHIRAAKLIGGAVLIAAVAAVVIRLLIPLFTPPQDSDGDNHSADADCDDTRADVYPGAAEVCDGADNDCDGSTDEGVTTTFYADADGDGFGDGGVTAEGCEAPSGYVEAAGDCDDGRGMVHPGAEEVCDGIDNDCDGQTDEEGVTEWYTDADGDGYGDPSTAQTGCAPSGRVPESGDCDDTDSAIHPGAEEVCDGVDNDCDGQTDNDAADALTFYADTDADGFGDEARPAAACSRPSGFVADRTDCDDTDSSINPDATERIGDGTDNDCDGLEQCADLRFTGRTHDGSGKLKMRQLRGRCFATPLPAKYEIVVQLNAEHRYTGRPAPGAGSPVLMVAQRGLMECMSADTGQLTGSGEELVLFSASGPLICKSASQSVPHVDFSQQLLMINTREGFFMVDGLGRVVETSVALPNRWSVAFFIPPTQ